MVLKLSQKTEKLLLTKFKKINENIPGKFFIGFEKQIFRYKLKLS